MPAPVIHQALHGYADGHRLLVSSRPLPQDAERQMLVMSDLSGPGFVKGFDGYLTGYPLRAASLYALARTWYAPEMDRPGCVFTQTLLIDFADLATLPVLTPLLALFERPQTTHYWEPYQKPLSFRPGPVATESLPPVTADLLRATYVEWARTILLETDSASRYELLALMLWQQQWPRLRRSFMFCTGALGARFLGRNAFDFLCVPGHLLRQVQRDLPTSLLLEASEQKPTFVGELLADLRKSPVTSLRQFLLSYGADVEQPRAAMRPLVETYIALSEQPRPVEDHIRRLGEAFPNNGAAARLKYDLFGVPTKYWPESSVVFALATTAHEPAFALADYQLAERTGRLYAVDRQDAIRLLTSLLKKGKSSRTHELVSALAPQLQPADLDSLQSLGLAEWALLLSSEPNLALNRSFWSGDEVRQEALLHMLAVARPGESTYLTELAAFLLSEHLDHLADHYLREWGIAAVYALLMVIDKGSVADDLTEPWLRALLNHPQAVLRWLEAKDAPRAVLLASLLVNLSSIQLTEQIDVADAQLERLARYLRQNDRIVALRILRSLSRSDCNEIGHRILRALAAAIDSKDALTIRELDPPILTQLVQLNPSLASHPAIWQGSVQQQWQLLRALRASENLSAEFLQVIAEVFLQRKDPAADAFIECLGPPGVTALLNQICLAENLPGTVWQRALSDTPSTIVDWLRHQEKPPSNVVAWLAVCLDPLSSTVQRGDLEFWAGLWLSGRGSLSGAQKNLFATFLLTVALRNSEPTAGVLARETFSLVHQLAARDDLPYEAGPRLVSLLPELGYFKNWDICERLRRAFARPFVERRWPESDLVRAIDEQSLFRATMDSCRKLDGGKKFLRHLQELVAKNFLEVPYWQYRIIDDF